MSETTDNAAIRDDVERALAHVATFNGDGRCALNCHHAEALAGEVRRLRAREVAGYHITVTFGDAFERPGFTAEQWAEVHAAVARISDVARAVRDASPTPQPPQP